MLPIHGTIVKIVGHGPTCGNEIQPWQNRTQPPKSATIHQRHSHGIRIAAIAKNPRFNRGLMYFAPLRGANMITLKSIPVWATSGGPTHDEPMAAPWVIFGFGL